MVQPRPPRLFTTDDVLAGEVILDAYPFRYICLSPTNSSVLGSAFRGRAGLNDLLDQVLSAAELLETRGWELVGINIDQGVTVACMRRLG